MIGKTALILGALSAASAQPIALGTVNSGMPPERFRGNAASVVVFTDRAGIEAICGKSEPPNIMLACRRAFPNGTPLVVMPNPCLLGESEFFAKIMCHEMGHVNGWTGNHEE